MGMNAENKNQLLKQCTIWHEEDGHEKIIDAISMLNDDERDYETDSILARAYNNVGNIQDRPELGIKALELLLPYQNQYYNDYFWNYRTAYAYMLLSQNNLACHYFCAAIDAITTAGTNVENKELLEEDATILLNQSYERLSYQYFTDAFSKRVQKAWQQFEKEEALLRTLFDGAREQGDALLQKKMTNILDKALYGYVYRTYVEVDQGRPKYVVEIGGKCNKLCLFAIDYFIKHAPVSLLENWEFVAGLSPEKELENHGFTLLDKEVTLDDIQLVLNTNSGLGMSVEVYSSKFKDLLQAGEDEKELESFLNATVEMSLTLVIGELNAAKLWFRISPIPLKESFSLKELRGKLEDAGFDFVKDVDELLTFKEQSFMVPILAEEDMQPRDDIGWSMSEFPEIDIDNKNNFNETDFLLAANGIGLGFLQYQIPESWCDEDTVEPTGLYKEEQVLLERIKAVTGDDGIELIGIAQGTYRYLDFIFWGENASISLMGQTSQFFEGIGVKDVFFHCFNKGTGSIKLA